jgi:hypothetical protein
MVHTAADRYGNRAREFPIEEGKAVLRFCGLFGARRRRPPPSRPRAWWKEDAG